jgi:hypothetical protein
MTQVMKIKTSYDDIHNATFIQYVSDLLAISLISSVQFGNVSTYIRNHIYVDIGLAELPTFQSVGQISLTGVLYVLQFLCNSEVDRPHD